MEQTENLGGHVPPVPLPPVPTPMRGELKSVHQRGLGVNAYQME